MGICKGEIKKLKRVSSWFILLFYYYIIIIWFNCSPALDYFAFVENDMVFVMERYNNNKTYNSKLRIKKGGSGGFN